MKAQILNTGGEKIKEIELPGFFSEKIREDLIKKAYDIIASGQRQSYGAFLEAGKRACARLRHRRRKWKTTYGKGISRTPRKIMTRRGVQFYWIGAFSPNTRGGRSAHAPTAEKIWARSINAKEKRRALLNALAATASQEYVSKKYGKIAKIPQLPIIVSGMEKITKTKHLMESLNKILNGLIGKKILIVSTKKIPVKNLGIETANVKNLSILQLASGGIPGRLTVYTEDAIKELEKLK